MSIIDQHNVDINKLIRNYELNPLLKGCNQYTSKAEIPEKEDLIYLYIELNIPRNDLCEYFNCGPTKFKKWLKYYDIKKNQIQRSMNKSKISMRYYGIIKSKSSLENYIINNNIETITELSSKINFSTAFLSRLIKKYELNKYFNAQKSFQEKELQEYVMTLIDIECNERTILKPYEMDIYIPSLNIGIEYMGEYWHNYNVFPKRLISDQNKRKIALEKGITIIDIWEKDWMNNRNDIKIMLKDLISNK